MSKNHQKATEPKEEVKPVVPETPEPIKETPAENPAEHLDSNELVSDSIQSHSAQITEGEAAQARAEGIDLKEQPLDPHDGAQLDQKTEAAEFDHDAEEAAANAEPEEQPEPVKNAVVNPNGLGSEWPRG